MSPRVLAIGAHPDDVEFMMSGTLLMLARAGYKLYIHVVASGSCGSATDDRDTVVRVRLEEAKTAAAVIGAQFHPPIADDLEVLYTLPLLRKVAAIVRQTQPDIILTHAPDEYMEDHINTCRLTVTAAFSRGMRNFITSPEIVPITKNVTIYHALPYGLRDSFGTPVTPEMYVNITDMLQKKREALACHISQKKWLDASQGLNSYLQTMEDMGHEVG
ncbi:MAG: PIG-L family deacetylase, partial [Candidatus Hydrogenedentes bacterium]|nr:PIG-L family deacetylase [Candidatus Hydrogenedentota bacterium]